MSSYYYYFLGVLWVVSCILLGAYVRGRSISGKKKYAPGLKIIVISYLFGLCLLVLAIMMA